MSDVRADIKVQTMIYDLFGLVTAEGQCFETKNYTAAFSKTSEVWPGILWLFFSKAWERKVKWSPP